MRHLTRIDVTSMPGTDSTIYVYHNIRGPLVDRIDIHIEVPSVAFRDLSGGTPGTSSENCASSGRRPESTVGPIQRHAARHNGHITHRQIRQFCKLDDECQNMLKGAMTKLASPPAPRQGPPRLPHDRRPRWSESIRPIHLHEAINTERWTGICGHSPTPQPTA